MAIDPARLRPLDLLREYEILAECQALPWLLDELAGGFADMALYADKDTERELARQKHLAVLDVRAALQAKIAGYRLAHEAELAEERERAAKQEAA
jgi:hypothetical protein